MTTLRGAAMVLGMRALKIVALGFTLANELPRKGVAAGLDLGVYWHRSLVNAVIARSLARSVNRALVEEAFLCGLLSELGKLALTHAMPDDVRAGRDRGRRLAVRRARARAARLLLERGDGGHPPQLAGARGRRRRRLVRRPVQSGARGRDRRRAAAWPRSSASPASARPRSSATRPAAG